MEQQTQTLVPPPADNTPTPFGPLLTEPQPVQPAEPKKAVDILKSWFTK